MNKILFLFLILSHQVFSQPPNNYVYLQGKQFYLNNEKFDIIAVNYMVNMNKNLANNDYYISPHWNYSAEWGFPNTGYADIATIVIDEFITITTTTKNNAKVGNEIALSGVTGTIDTLHGIFFKIIKKLDDYTIVLNNTSVDSAFTYTSSLGLLYNEGGKIRITKGRCIYSKIDDRGVSNVAFDRDLSKIKTIGFNSLRICGIATGIKDGKIKIPEGMSESEYFQQLIILFDKLESNNLKAILLIGGPYSNPECDKDYCDFLTRLSTALKNKTSLIGYDFLNEPHKTKNFNKYKLSKRISNWHSAIKKGSPNHLTTIGYSFELIDIVDMDPMIQPVDFASFHHYSWTKDINDSKDRLAVYLYFLGTTITKPWIIGETGFAGTNKISTSKMVGTENEQYEFADFTLYKAFECNCSGYSWWQYKEVDWPFNDIQDYLGLITRYDARNPDSSEREKPAVNAFKNFSIKNVNYNNCIKPYNYYNMYNYSNVIHEGRVVDKKGNPIINAIVYSSSHTFTDENGYFKCYSDNPSKNNIEITALGYNSIIKNNSSYDMGTITLFEVNSSDSWIKFKIMSKRTVVKNR